MQKRINRARSIAVNIPITIFLSILALLVLVPVLWIILGTFKPEKEIISYPPTFIPHTLTLENFASVSGRIKIWRYALNSLIYAGGTTTIAMFVNSLAGYVYARFTFKGKTICFLLTLATMMVPFQVIMVPLFLIVFNLGMWRMAPAAGAAIAPPEGLVPVSREGVSSAMSTITSGSSAGAKQAKDTTTSPVLPLSAVPVLPPMR